MEWLLDNLQLVIVVVIIASYVLRGLRNRSAGEEEPGEAPEADDPGAAERTRRIQEEIRRRILERQRGAPPESFEPIFVEEPEEEPPPVAIPPPMPVQRRAPQPNAYALDSEQEAALARQSRMLEQLEDLRRARATAPTGRSATATPYRKVRPARSESSLRAALRRDLSGPDGLRRAVLLREILGEAPGMSVRAGVPRS